MNGIEDPVKIRRKESEIERNQRQRLCGLGGRWGSEGEGTTVGPGWRGR